MKINFLKRLAILFLITLWSHNMWAQRTITGVVTDTITKEILIGASIVVTGMTQGVLTDVDGKYALQVPANATSLTFSFVGYRSLTLQFGQSNVLNATLTGQGCVETKITTPYDVRSQTTLKAADFNKGSIHDPIQLLQGRVAGLGISRVGGNPNAPFDVQLRGLTTLASTVKPLIVVDGIPTLI
jgi:TonB-dependent starch-binding outer membrane protein SusC